MSARPSSVDSAGQPGVGRRLAILQPFAHRARRYLSRPFTSPYLKSDDPARDQAERRVAGDSVVSLPPARLRALAGSTAPQRSRRPAGASARARLVVVLFTAMASEDVLAQVRSGGMAGNGWPSGP